MIRRIVDDQKDLARGESSDKALDKTPESFTVEDIGELVREIRPVEADRSKNVRSLPLTISIDARLHTDACPRAMESTVEPKTGFVFEHYYSTTGGGFFFISGNFVRSQYSWASASALASRLRGRCTENPNLCNRRGM